MKLQPYLINQFSYFFLKIKDCDVSPIVFFDLIELEGQGAEQIYASLLKSLLDGGFLF